jgi:hypothetical protein
MWKIDKYGCYVWTVFNDDGVVILHSAPIIGDSMIDLEDTVDVSKSAFTDDELNEFVAEVGRVAEQPRVTVRGWIRG